MHSQSWRAYGGRPLQNIVAQARWLQVLQTSSSCQLGHTIHVQPLYLPDCLCTSNMNVLSYVSSIEPRHSRAMHSALSINLPMHTLHALC